MITEILPPSKLAVAVKALLRGEPVAFATETVYGLGAPIFFTGSVKKIFSIKGRPSDNPLIAHIAHLDQLDSIAKEVPDSFYRLAEKFWPGPLTMILKKNERVPNIVSAFHPTIAVRMPSHFVARELIAEVGVPLVAPSANLSGRPSPTSAQDVFEDLSGKIHFIVDGGSCEIGLESTVISLIHETPILLRPGKVTKEELELFLNAKLILPQKGGPVLSPGMKYRHYAPNAKVKLAMDLSEIEGPFITPTEQSLYAQLRDADRQNLEMITIYCDEKTLSNAALMNRLLRASGQID